MKIEIHIDDNDRTDPTVGDRPWAANLRGIDDENKPIFALPVGFGATAAEAVANLIAELDTNELDQGVTEQVQGFVQAFTQPTSDKS